MRVVVIAGPNGAGKSTFAAEYLGREGEGPPFVNGDDIAADLNPGDPGAVAGVAASSPWKRPREHRDRRGAGLARRDEGRIAALFVRGETQSGALNARKVQ